MSILDTHITDAEIANLGQTIFDVVHHPELDFPALKVSAATFFLRPDKPGGTVAPAIIAESIRKELYNFLPADIVRDFPLDVPAMPEYLLAPHFIDKENFIVVLPRSDNRSTLAQRVSHRTGIKLKDLAIVNQESVVGFDNLSLLYRLYQLFNVHSAQLLKTVEKVGFSYIHHTSMVAAKRDFMNKGGDEKTVEIYEAVAYAAAFTLGKVPFEYANFASVLGFPEHYNHHAHRDVFGHLQGLRPVNPKRMQNAIQVNPIPPEDLLPALADLLDTYENEMTGLHGKRLRAFQIVFSRGLENDKEAHSVLSGLSVEEMVETAKHYVAFKTLQGLKLLMGDKTGKYLPEKNMQAFVRISNSFKVTLQ